MWIAGNGVTPFTLPWIALQTCAFEQRSCAATSATVINPESFSFNVETSSDKNKKRGAESGEEFSAPARPGRKDVG
jgi:hypothetical protein